MVWVKSVQRPWALAYVIPCFSFPFSLMISIWTIWRSYYPIKALYKYSILQITNYLMYGKYDLLTRYKTPSSQEWKLLFILHSINQWLLNLCILCISKISRERPWGSKRGSKNFIWLNNDILKTISRLLLCVKVN